MKIKNTAFVWNVTVNGHSNCDWGTELGQSKKHTFKLEGFPEILNAMVYYKIKATDTIKMVLGKGRKIPMSLDSYSDSELVLASCFTKIFINDKELSGQRFVMCIIKEINDLDSSGNKNVHCGRCSLKFGASIELNGEPVNLRCIEAISDAFGVDRKDGSWAILEMHIENEDELHLGGFAFGNAHKDYSSADERNKDFDDRLSHVQSLAPSLSAESDKVNFCSNEYDYISAIRTKPFLILGGFSGTGKSQKVKELAYATCPVDKELRASETCPGNYLLLSVKPNWHDATDITGFRSSVNNNYYVTDFMRFLVKAKRYEKCNVPFFVCLDEMNLAPVEEYFADFLSVIESRKKQIDGIIVTDPIVPASVFNDVYAPDFNIFLRLGIEPAANASDIRVFNEAIQLNGNDEGFYEDYWLVKELKQNGLTIPQNLIIIGTVNLDDTTNSFSRKVIDRAMTFETIVEEFSVDGYFNSETELCYSKNPKPGNLFISDEVRATELPKAYLTDEEQQKIVDFINGINSDLKGSPFKVSYRILNETVLLYRARKEIKRIVESELGGFEENIKFSTNLSKVFDDILMQKVLPRIEGDYDKCNSCLTKLSKSAELNGWNKSADKIEFMIKRFGKDKSGVTSFWN